MNKLLSSIAGIGLMVSTAGVMASPITVGVATWDPDFDNAPASFDFNSGGTLSQFYTSNDNTATKVVSSDDYTNVISAGSVAVGDFLTGVGSFTSFNSNLNFLCSGCELTYAFGGIKVSALTSNTDVVFDVSKSWLTVYSDTSSDFSPADASSYAQAQDGDVFLNAAFSTLKLKAGTLLTGATEGLINVLAGGLSEGHFDTNGQLGGTDLKMSGTGNFDSSTALLFSNAGQLTAVGNSIPEPASLALLGLGLLGFGATSRRKAK